MTRSSGQVFIVASVIFSGLLLITFLATGPIITSNQIPDTRRFFSQSLDETNRAFNLAISDNYSVPGVKRRIYSYDRFVERRGLEKGIEFKAYHLLVFPEKDTAVFINYFNSQSNVRLKINGDWSNRTLSASQSFDTSFKGNADVFLDVDQNNISHEFRAATPKILTYAVMESSDETWKNTLLG